MAEPIELKFSLNTLPNPDFKVCDGEVDPSPETPIFADFHRCSTGGSIFHFVLLKSNFMYVANPIPNVALHPQFVGTTDSAGFQGPIARSVSDEFRHFFTQIVTEYDGDSIPTVADC